MNWEMTEGGRCRTLTDGHNPRIYNRQWMCKGCNNWTGDEDVIWARPNGVLDTDRGDPWCIDCVPEETDDAS